MKMEGKDKLKNILLIGLGVITSILAIGLFIQTLDSNYEDRSSTVASDRVFFLMGSVIPLLIVIWNVIYDVKRKKDSV